MKKTIMVADDSPIIRKLITFSLSIKGYEIISVNDGMEALEILPRENIDLLITDLNMPNVDGFELIKAVRENDELKHTPIIVLSNLSETDDIERALQFGADSYLIKPFEQKTILNEVQIFKLIGEVMNLKFLVVDDSVTMRRIVINSLANLNYLDYVEASDGKDALAKLESNPDINFVITDWNMPEMSGLELVKAIRSDERFSELPVLMVTTRGLKNDIIEALKARVNNYILKPFTPQVLREKIEQILSTTITEK